MKIKSRKRTTNNDTGALPITDAGGHAQRRCEDAGNTIVIKTDAPNCLDRGCSFLRFLPPLARYRRLPPAYPNETSPAEPCATCRGAAGTIVAVQSRPFARRWELCAAM
jgi:hypothetical protein